jgi:DNA modification methylase
MDPFGGSGTTALAAANLGRDSVYAEVNPYLAWIADVKVNQARQAAMTGGARELRTLANEIFATLPPVDQDHALLIADRLRGYFPDGVADKALGVLALIDKTLTGAAREVARLALATSLVPASRMVRRTDLRRRTSRDPVPLNLLTTVEKHLRAYADDVEQDGTRIQGTARRIAGDVREHWLDEPEISVIVTSPPYLNGTNYCRNTKLELLALDYIESERDLKGLRTSMISAGINNVSKRRPTARSIDCVEPIAEQLDEAAYDIRIPALVRTYFSDMQVALSQVRKRAVPGAQMYLDIGDSRYCGVQVPTPSLLQEIAETEGWRFLDQDVLRTRRSYDGTQLTQVLMHFEVTS